MRLVKGRRDYSLARRKAESLAEIRDFRANFEASVLAANAAGSTYSEPLIPHVRAQFTKLEQSVTEVATKDELGALERQAQDLTDLRAYICPSAEIPIAGRTVLNTMDGWGVPQKALDALKKEVEPHFTNPVKLDAGRAALFEVLRECTSWSNYIDDFRNEMQKTTYLLTAWILTSLVASILLISLRYVVLGLLAAGACGAFVSVISKLPTLQVSGGGDIGPYKRGVWRRVCTGLAASIIGIGLLISGIVTISFPQGVSIPNTIDACATPGSQCSTRYLLVLIAIVMLFGLSERALTSFEDTVFAPRP